MFHFTLVHIPGTYHGPDGLSRRRLQPGDQEEIEDDFKDWIDHINGFIHLVNPSPISLNYITTSPPVTAFISESAEATNIVGVPQTELSDQPAPTYDNVPCSTGANKADKILTESQTLVRTITASRRHHKQSL